MTILALCTTPHLTNFHITLATVKSPKSCKYRLDLYDMRKRGIQLRCLKIKCSFNKCNKRHFFGVMPDLLSKYST